MLWFLFYHCLLFFLHIQLFTELTFFAAFLRKRAYSVSISLPLQASQSHPWAYLCLVLTLSEKKTEILDSPVILLLCP